MAGRVPAPLLYEIASTVRTFATASNDIGIAVLYAYSCS